MLKQIHVNLWIGDIFACSQGAIVPGHVLLTQPHVTVHACKDPCHRVAIGYVGKIDPTHPEYLARETGTDLFLNMIDPPTPLFQLPTFHLTHAFIAKHIAKLPVIIHCNQGNSRAPALAMTYLASAQILPPAGYEATCAAFLAEFPTITFSKGIDTFMREHWEEITHARLSTETTAQTEESTDEHVPDEDASDTAQDQGQSSISQE